MKISNGKLGNKGFSLAELLIAVGILVIVAGPLLYSFVVSQRISRNSHVLGEATMTSRNIIETIRAEGVYKIVNTINPDAGDPSVIGTSPFGGTVSAINFNRDDGYYEVDINGISGGTTQLLDFAGTAVTNGSMTLNAKVIIDAARYRSPDPVADPFFNDVLITEYLPVDGLFVQPRDTTSGSDPDPDALAIEYYASELILRGMNPSIAETEAKRLMERSIFINVDLSPSADDVSIIVAYSYKLTYSGEVILFDVPPYFDVYWDHYDSLDPKPISVYFFYRPHYSGPPANIDYIYINNTGQVDVTFFLVKQKPTGHNLPGFDVGQFALNEANYKADIRHIEHQSLYVPAPGISEPPKTKILTNFNLNMFTEADGISGNFRLLTGYAQFLNNFPTVLPSGYFTRSYENVLVSKTTRDRMYDITVTVFNAADGEQLLEFTATHLD